MGYSHSHVTRAPEAPDLGAERSGEDQRMANKEKGVATETVTTAAGHGGRAEAALAKDLSMP